MPRKTAGARYPHASSTARQHDHRWCAVVEAIADQVQSGAEEWGTPHPLGRAFPDEPTAKRTRAKFFNAKFCKVLARKYGELMSVRCEYEWTEKGYVLTVQVWPRSVARAEITRRVTQGEKLAYNPWKEKP